MRGTKFCLAVLVVLVCVGQVFGEPVQWNGHSYSVVVNGDASWDQAKAMAATFGWYLATITSPEEQQFLEDLLVDSGSPTGGYWIGLKETDTVGVYQWDNDEPLTYTNWNPGEPNHGPSGGERVHMLWTSDADSSSEYYDRRGGWNDIRGEGYETLGPWTDLWRAGYIAEVPEPSTFVLLGIGAVGMLAYARRKRRRA